MLYVQQTVNSFVFMSVAHTNLFSQEGDPAPKATASTTTSTAPKTEAGGMGVGVYALILVGGALAFFAYQYLQGAQNKS